MTEIDGWVAPGFEGARDAFRANFDEGREVGAAFSAFHKGRKVVDLWGGVADQESGAPWEEDTLMLVFSTTKGMTAEEALSWEPVIEALQNQHPHWEPGTQHGYHATTFGWLVGEVIRRVADRSVGAYLHDEVATPLGLDLWIGLPEEQESRVGRLISFLPPGISMDVVAAEQATGEPDPVRELIMAFLGPDTMLGKALFAPGNALADDDIWNSRAMHAAEVPAANGIADARSVAKMYAACVSEVDGIRLLTPDQVTKATTKLTEGPNTVLMDMDIQFGLGFMLRTDLLALGGPRSFGHFGAGGSVGWADPDAELSFGYVMNRMDLGMAGDVRSASLINACYDAIS